MYLLIATLYVLVALIGNQNVQLLVGMISALGTVASATVAYRLFRNSVRGAEISVAFEDPMEIETEYQVRRTLLTQIPPGTTQELFESLHFDFPLVWLNGGPTGGAITAVEFKLVKPLSPFHTIREGEDSEDNISVRWEMNVAQLEERISLDSVRLPIFASYSQNPMSIGSNESIAVVTTVDLFLMDRRKGTRPPLLDWRRILQDISYLELKIQWKTATKGKLTLNQRSLKIRLKLRQPIHPAPTTPNGG